MGSLQQGTVVLRILRNENGGWDVLENESGKALASFEDRQQACDYANGVSMTKPGAIAVVLDESPANAQNQDAARP